MALIHQEPKLSSAIQTMQLHSDRFPGYSQDFLEMSLAYRLLRGLIWKQQSRS
jgi:hypothetical protein